MSGLKKIIVMLSVRVHNYSEYFFFECHQKSSLMYSESNKYSCTMLYMWFLVYYCDSSVKQSMAVTGKSRISTP